MALLTTFVIRVYKLLLRLYPRAFRDEFGDEMATTFARQVDEAGQEGPGAVIAVGLREAGGFPGTLLTAYAHSWRQLQPASVAPNPLWLPA